MNAPDPVGRGWRALLAGGWQEARSSFEEALEQGETPEALDGLASSAGWLDDAATALSARERAYRLFRQRNDPEMAARVAFSMALDVLNFRGDPAVASGWIQRGRDLLRDRPESPWLGAIDLAEAWMAVLFHKDIPRARRLAERALEAGYRTGVPDLLIIAKSRLGQVLVSAGQVADGMRLLDEASAAALAGEMFDAASSVAVCCSLMTACLRVRDLDRAAQWYRQAGELADRRLAEPFRSWRWEYGTVLVWWGRWEEAERELIQEMEAAAARPVQAGMAQVALADLRRRQGRFDQAADLLDDLDARPGRSGLAHLTMSTRAALSLDHGDHQTAIDLAETYLRAVPRDDPVERVDALEILARARAALGDPEGAEVPAAELHDIAEGVGTAALRAAAGLAAGEVAAARGDAAGARDAFEGARDLFDQAGAPFEAARARLGLAWSLVTLGRSDRATPEARAAQLAFDALGARADAERVTRLLGEMKPDTAAGSDLRLTAREVEVLRLVGRGRTNEEVASELFLSVRTVERHLSNVYSKIGVHGRAARVLASTYASKNGLT
jgi:ATP/maltotriose-dependent transcriptional regulator MalT